MFALLRFLDAFDKKEYVVPASNVKDFHPRNYQYFSNNKYHVANGFCIGSQQAQKIMAQKKPSLVAKDMAQAICGREALANRTYGGKLAPKHYKNPDATVRKQMSPEKVALIITADDELQTTNCSLDTYYGGYNGEV
ncbi:uncharacterized protein LOC119382226 [Rhipicephalus sanguineus]|uniref:uncharacterized protein LOC119382226 n=1 Tax=Rhipicephalus sanguineus TaxID=34632 RepID=UPI0018955EF8|nr:uncharacterized protein LOC119382226 [Rhipicephalus sanguineus]